jgi:hypothetical protein
MALSWNEYVSSMLITAYEDELEPKSILQSRFFRTGQIEILLCQESCEVRKTAV